jgi:hypothetical protein
MASKKKNKKKSPKPKKSAGKKSTPAKLKAQKGRTPKKSTKSTKKKSAPKKLVAKAKTVVKSAKKEPGAQAAGASEGRRGSSGRRAFTPSSEMLGPGSAGQSGDLQGLSGTEGADSESVDELIEEGNAFEAGVVEGVEDSGRGGMKEVRTREVPEDDVPGEYLDEE